VNKKTLWVMAVLLLMSTVVFTACGGSGGSSSFSGIPYISAELNSFPTGSVPPGFVPPGFNSNASVYVTDPNSGDSITNAAVTMNGMTLTYNATNQDYEVNLMVAPGATVTLSVTVGGNTYTAVGTQFTSYPTMTAPAPGTTWHASIANTVTWSGGTPMTSAWFYGLGILDANDPNGDLVWPQDNFLHDVSISENSYSIPANSLTTGNRLVIAGVATVVNIPDNMGFSAGAFFISGFNYVPITTSNATLESIAVTPTNPSIGTGQTQQFTATGTFSDNRTQDLTAQASWTSSDPNKAFISSSGLAYQTHIGTTTISARLGNISDSTLFTITPAVLVSIDISPKDAVIPQGTPLQLTAIGTLSDGTTQDVSTSVVWSSSDEEVATIDNAVGSKGLVTSKSGGATTITATLGSVVSSTMLTVTGVTWSSCVSGTTYDLNGVTWSGTMLVAVGGTSEFKKGQVAIITSPDSVTWTTRSSGALSALNDIVWSGSQFVTIGPTDLLNSPDGVAWTIQPHGNIYLKGIAWSGSKFVSTGSEYDYSSSDGTTWAIGISLVAHDLHDIVWSGTQFITVGRYGVIFTSPDGVSWTKQNPGYTNTLNGIAWSGSLLSAVGESGAILTSPDGITWTKRDSGSSNNLNAVIWSGYEFLAVGAYGTILTSPDGITWTSQGWGPGTYGPNLRNVTWMGSKYVAVGDGGTIITSQ
jgi:hypothetical protein